VEVYAGCRLPSLPLSIGFLYSSSDVSFFFPFSRFVVPNKKPVLKLERLAGYVLTDLAGKFSLATIRNLQSTMRRFRILLWFIQQQTILFCFDQNVLLAFPRNCQANLHWQIFSSKLNRSWHNGHRPSALKVANKLGWM
jgi:hypothetical protein